MLNVYLVYSGKQTEAEPPMSRIYDYVNELEPYMIVTGRTEESARKKVKCLPYDHDTSTLVHIGYVDTKKRATLWAKFIKECARIPLPDFVIAEWVVGHPTFAEFKPI